MSIHERMRRLEKRVEELERKARTSEEFQGKVVEALESEDVDEREPPAVHGERDTTQSLG